VRYLCVDLGDKRTGLALGDDVTRLVSPLPTIEVPISIADGTALLEALARAVEEQVGVARAGATKTPSRHAALIFGLPLNMDGTENPRTRIVRAFATRLGGRVGLEVKFQDERLTTVDADWQMARSGLTRGEKKQKRDALAAATILRDFLGGDAKPEE
jgi:putative Holliday junction resolvase